MLHSEDEESTLEATWAMDGLGRMIRWSLEDAVAGIEPPPDMWRRISGRIEELNQPARRRPLSGSTSFPWSALLQTVVVTTLLFAFVVGVDRRAAERQAPAAAVPAATTRSESDVAESPPDMLSGRLRFLLQRDRPARQTSAPGAEPGPTPGAHPQLGYPRRGSGWREVQLPD